MKLLTSLTGPAHEDIRNLVEQGDTVTSNYHNLASLYDSTPKPNKAKQDLVKFKIPRQWDLYKAQNHILSLSNSAARLYKDSKIRKINITTYAYPSPTSRANNYRPYQRVTVKAVNTGQPM